MCKACTTEGDPDPNKMSEKYIIKIQFFIKAALKPGIVAHTYHPRVSRRKKEVEREARKEMGAWRRERKRARKGRSQGGN